MSWKAFKKIYAMCRHIKQQRGGAFIKYLADALYCAYKHGTSPENYFVLRFFLLNNKERSEYLTSGRSKELDAKLNKNASPREKKILASKNLFNKHFSPFVHRESLYAPEADFAGMEDFINRHPVFIIKPTGGTMGKGIEKIYARDISSPQDFFDRCREKGLLLEELICQHPDLDKISPNCVNSVRINAARDRQGNIKLIGACLKCAGAGAVTDNFHTGGIAYPLDLSTGKVSGPGRNNIDLNDYIYHPPGNFYMPGFQVPLWEDILNCVYNAMDLIPSIGYVGWDIAVTPFGAELIEGNYNWPGGNIIQFDGVGKYPLLLSCLQ